MLSHVLSILEQFKFNCVLKYFPKSPVLKIFLEQIFYHKTKLSYEFASLCFSLILRKSRLKVRWSEKLMKLLLHSHHTSNTRSCSTQLRMREGSFHRNVLLSCFRKSRTEMCIGRSQISAPPPPFYNNTKKKHDNDQLGKFSESVKKEQKMHL